MSRWWMLVREIKSRYARRLRDGICTVAYGFMLKDLLTCHFCCLSPQPYRVFITDLSYGHSIFCNLGFLRYVRSRLLSLLFCFMRICLYTQPLHLSGYLNILSEFVTDHNPLTAILAHTFGFINHNPIYKFSKKWCSSQSSGAFFSQNAFAASFSNLRICRCWGQAASHWPHSMQASAFTGRAA